MTNCSQACRAHPPDQRITGSRFTAPSRQQHEAEHHYQDDVENDRRGSGSGKPVQGIQDAANQGDQRHEGEIGECDTGQLNRQVELFRIIDEAGRQDVNDQRHGQHGQRRQQDQEGQQDGQHFFGEPRCRRLALAFQPAGKQRNEGSVECSFGKQPAKQIWKPERNHKCIGNQPGSNDAGHEHVANKAQHARDHRHGGNCRSGS